MQQNRNFSSFSGEGNFVHIHILLYNIHMGILDNDRQRLEREGVPVFLNELLLVYRINKGTGVLYESVGIDPDDEVMTEHLDIVYDAACADLTSLIKARERKDRFVFQGFQEELDNFIAASSDALEHNLRTYLVEHILPIICAKYTEEVTQTWSARDLDVLSTEALEEGTGEMFEHRGTQQEDLLSAVIHDHLRRLFKEGPAGASPDAEP